MTRYTSLVAVAIALLVAPFVSADEGKPAKKVLILGIDGCRADALVAAKAVNLQGLIKDGASSLKGQTGDKTVSGPGWCSILTGVWREKHGVVDNDFKDHHLKEYPHFFQRLKEARPQAFAASIVHWGPIAERIVVAADLNETRKTDAAVAEEATKVLARPELDVLFVHFDDVDHAGHAKGFHPSVPEYVAAIEKVDGHVGELLAALRKRPTFAAEDWLVIVCTDHGGSGTSHGKDIPEHRTVFLIVSGPSAQPGAIDPPPGVVDVAATALTHFGVPIAKEWNLDGKAVGLKRKDP